MKHVDFGFTNNKLVYMCIPTLRFLVTTNTNTTTIEPNPFLIECPMVCELGLLFTFCGITKEMMSRGPQVADMKCRETTWLAVSIFTYGSPLYHHSLDPLSTHTQHELASRQHMGLAPCGTSQVLWKVIILIFEAFNHVVLKLLLIIEYLVGHYSFDPVSPWWVS